MGRLSLVWTSEARRDLAEIWFYIQKRSGSVGPADRVNQAIVDALHELTENLGLAHPRPEVTLESLLFCQVFSYQLILQVSGQDLIVVGILHGARDLSEVLKDR